MCCSSAISSLCDLKQYSLFLGSVTSTVFVRVPGYLRAQHSPNSIPAGVSWRGWSAAPCPSQDSLSAGECAVLRTPHFGTHDPQNGLLYMQKMRLHLALYTSQADPSSVPCNLWPLNSPLLPLSRPCSLFSNSGCSLAGPHSHFSLNLAKVILLHRRTRVQL